MEEDGGSVPILSMRMKALMLGSCYLACMFIAAGLGIPRLTLALTGRDGSGTEGIDLMFQVKIDPSEPNDLRLLATCTNHGETSLRVESLEPAFSLETPSSLHCDAVYSGNISLLDGPIVLEPGQSISRKHNLLDSWWKRKSDNELLSGRAVFREVGEYRITARYVPFMTDADPEKQRIALISYTSFMLHTDPAHVEGRMDVKITDLWTRHSLKLVDYVNVTDQSTMIYTIIIFGNATNHGDSGWVTIRGYLEHEEIQYGPEERLYFYAGMSATVHAVLEYPVPRSRQDLPPDYGYGFQVTHQEPD